MTADEIEATLIDLVPRVRRWVYRQLGPRPDFDDVVQDALVELAGALAGFEGRAKVSTFAYSVVMRTTYRAMRPQAGPATDPTAMAELPDTDDPEARAASRQQLARLHRVLERLPEKQRVAFVLCAVERLPHAEAAEIEGVSVETLRARLKRARAELGRRLGADPEMRAMLRGPS
ncbi:MAG: RNA polymerase sigma factor [Sandaracinaceae bacterium]